MQAQMSFSCPLLLTSTENVKKPQKVPHKMCKNIKKVPHKM